MDPSPYAWLVDKGAMLSAEEDAVVAESRIAMHALDLENDYKLGNFLFHRFLEIDANTVRLYGESELKKFADRSHVLRCLERAFSAMRKRCVLVRPEEHDCEVCAQKVDQILGALQVLQTGAAIWAPDDARRAAEALERGEVLAPESAVAEIRSRC